METETEQENKMANKVKFFSKPLRVKVLFILVFLALVLLTLYVTWWNKQLSLPIWGKQEQDSPSDNSANQKEAVPVRLATVENATFREVVRGVGTLRAQERVEISPELDGIVTAIHFEEGQGVTRGTLLVSIDDRKLRRELAAIQSALRQARAQLEYAKKTYQRFEKLVADGAATRDRLDQTETQYESARSEVERLEAQVGLIEERLKDTQIAAPIDGVLGTRHIDIGDYAKRGESLVSLHTVQSMEAQFDVPERYTGKVQQGQPVEVLVEAYPERKFEGAVTYISPSVDDATRNFLVKATLDNSERLLKPGTFITALLILEVHRERPAIPESALVATTAGYIAFVVEDNVAHRREVTLGLRQVGLAEVRNGLSTGEKVVTEGHMRLSDGDKVKIVNEEKGLSGPADTPQPQS